MFSRSSLRTAVYRRVISIIILCAFVVTLFVPPAQAQVLSTLPLPGTMVSPSPTFVPVLLKGMTVHPENPLEFDFIVDTGHELRGVHGAVVSGGVHGDGTAGAEEEWLRNESNKLIKYFLASLTIPKDELWVNLSPYEHDRMIPEALAKTGLGQDLLAQDYLLKQLTASLMYPEDELGSAFWEKVYAQAREKFGTTDIPLDTFNKVWIIPESARVYEHENTVYVVGAKLKVLLEEDYLAKEQAKVTTSQGHKTQEEKNVVIPAKAGIQDKNGSPIKAFGDDKREGEFPASESSSASRISSVQSAIIREIIIPAIEKEVNEGKNFAPLRQIFHSLILAQWYKDTVRTSILSRTYVDRNKTVGIDEIGPAAKEEIYQQYMAAYKKGVYNYIKEEYDPATQDVIPHKYFSGGVVGKVAIDKAMLSDDDAAPVGENKNIKVQLDWRGRNAAARALMGPEFFSQQNRIAAVINKKLDLQLRKNSLYSLGNKVSRDAVDRLIAVVRDTTDNEQIRTIALEWLNKYMYASKEPVPDFIGFLFSLLGDQSERVVRRAESILRSLPVAPAPAQWGRAYLQVAQQTTDPERRRYAISQLQKFPYDGAVSFLLEQLSLFSSDPTMSKLVLDVLWAIEKQNNPASQVLDLNPFFSSPSTSQDNAMLGWWREKRDEKLARAYVRAVQLGEDALRRNAAKELVAMSLQRVVPLLSSFVGYHDRSVRAEVIDMLVGRGIGVEKALGWIAQERTRWRHVDDLRFRTTAVDSLWKRQLIAPDLVRHYFKWEGKPRFTKPEQEYYYVRSLIEKKVRATYRYLAFDVYHISSRDVREAISALIRYQGDFGVEVRSEPRLFIDEDFVTDVYIVAPNGRSDRAMLTDIEAEDAADVPVFDTFFGLKADSRVTRRDVVRLGSASVIGFCGGCMSQVEHIMSDTFSRLAGKVTPQERKDIHRLIRRLASPNSLQRSDAVEQLIAYGERAVPFLALFLDREKKSTDKLSVITAVYILGEIGPIAAPAIPAVRRSYRRLDGREKEVFGYVYTTALKKIRGMREPQQVTREKALQVMRDQYDTVMTAPERQAQLSAVVDSAMMSSLPLPILVSMIRASKNNIYTYVPYFVQGGKKAARLALRLLSDADPNVRFVAVMALRELNPPGTVPALLPLVFDPDRNVRLAVNRSFKDLGVPAAVQMAYISKQVRDARRDWNRITSAWELSRLPAFRPRLARFVRAAVMTAALVATVSMPLMCTIDKNIKAPAVVLTAEQQKEFDTAYQRGVRYNQSEQYIRALEMLNRARAIDPKNSRVWTELGRAYLGLSMIDAARIVFEEAIRLDPQNGQAYIGLGGVHGKMRNFDIAAGYLVKALEFFPRNAQLHCFLGHVYFEKKDYDAAIRSLTEAARLDRDLEEAQEYLALVQYELGNFGKAVEAIKEQLRINPNAAQAYWLLSRIFIEDDNLPAALKALEKAAELNPEYRDGYLRLRDYLNKYVEPNTPLINEIKEDFMVQWPLIDGLQIVGGLIDVTRTEPVWGDSAMLGTLRNDALIWAMNIPRTIDLTLVNQVLANSDVHNIAVLATLGAVIAGASLYKAYIWWGENTTRGTVYRLGSSSEFVRARAAAALLEKGVIAGAYAVIKEPWEFNSHTIGVAVDMIGTAGPLDTRTTRLFQELLSDFDPTVRRVVEKYLTAVQALEGYRYAPDYALDRRVRELLDAGIVQDTDIDQAMLADDLKDPAKRVTAVKILAQSNDPATSVILREALTTTGGAADFDFVVALITALVQRRAAWALDDIMAAHKRIASDPAVRRDQHNKLHAVVGNARMTFSMLASNRLPEDEDGSDFAMLAAEGLRTAARSGQIAKIKLFIERGIPIDAQDEQGLSALFHAIIAQHSDAVAFLIKNGASVALKNMYGVTPLMVAAYKGDPDIVRMLIARGAEREARDSARGQTALMYAVDEGNLQAAKALVDAYADIYASDDLGYTVIRRARDNADDEMLRVLGALGAPVERDEAMLVKGGAQMSARELKDLETVFAIRMIQSTSFRERAYAFFYIRNALLGIPALDGALTNAITDMRDDDPLLLSALFCLARRGGDAAIPLLQQRRVTVTDQSVRDAIDHLIAQLVMEGSRDAKETLQRVLEQDLFDPRSDVLNVWALLNLVDGGYPGAAAQVSKRLEELKSPGALRLFTLAVFSLSDHATRISILMEIARINDRLFDRDPLVHDLLLVTDMYRERRATLVRDLDTGDVAAQERAAYELGEMTDVQAREELVRMADSSIKHPQVMAAIETALLKINGFKFQREVVRLFEKDEPDGRIDAAVQVAKTADPQAVSLLLRAVREESIPTLRSDLEYLLEALIAEVLLRDEKLLSLVYRGENDAALDKMLRENVQTLSADDRVYLRGLLESKYWEDPDSVDEAMLAAPQKKLAAIAEKYAAGRAVVEKKLYRGDEDTSWYKRLELLHKAFGLYRKNDVDISALLVTALDDPQREIRFVAVSFAGYAKARGAIGPLTAVAARDTDALIREKALWVLDSMQKDLPVEVDASAVVDSAARKADQAMLGNFSREDITWQNPALVGYHLTVYTPDFLSPRFPAGLFSDVQIVTPVKTVDGFVPTKLLNLLRKQYPSAMSDAEQIKDFIDSIGRLSNDVTLFDVTARGVVQRLTWERISDEFDGFAVEYTIENDESVSVALKGPTSGWQKKRVDFIAFYQWAAELQALAMATEMPNEAFVARFFENYQPVGDGQWLLRFIQENRFSEQRSMVKELGSAIVDVLVLKRLWDSSDVRIRKAAGEALMLLRKELLQGIPQDGIGSGVNDARRVLIDIGSSDEKKRKAITAIFQNVKKVSLVDLVLLELMAIDESQKVRDEAEFYMLLWEQPGEYLFSASLRAAVAAQEVNAVREYTRWNPQAAAKEMSRAEMEARITNAVTKSDQQELYALLTHTSQVVRDATYREIEEWGQFGPEYHELMLDVLDNASGLVERDARQYAHRFFDAVYARIEFDLIVTRFHRDEQKLHDKKLQVTGLFLATATVLGVLPIFNSTTTGMIIGGLGVVSLSGWFLSKKFSIYEILKTKKAYVSATTGLRRYISATLRNFTTQGQAIDFYREIAMNRELATDVRIDAIAELRALGSLPGAKAALDVLRTDEEQDIKIAVTTAPHARAVSTADQAMLGTEKSPGDQVARSPEESAFNYAVWMMEYIAEPDALARFLKEKKPSVAINGETLLMKAASLGRDQYVDVLLDFYADVPGYSHLRDASGQRARDIVEPILSLAFSRTTPSESYMNKKSLTEAALPASSENPGGIDMNQIAVERSGSDGAPIEFDASVMQNIAEQDVTGFVPVIISITPIVNIMPLLGLANEGNPASPGKQAPGINSAGQLTSRGFRKLWPHLKTPGHQTQEVQELVAVVEERS